MSRFNDGKEFRSGDCNTTHWACDCVLKRLSALEKVAEAAEISEPNLAKWALLTSQLVDRCCALENALQRIADTDNRGHISRESQIALKALESK